MVFSSMTFMAAFLPAAILLYFICNNPKWRNGVLIVFSLLFYAWGEPQRILLMLASILVNYAMALVIARARSLGTKRLALVICMAVTLGMLGYFKYFAFFVNSIAGVLGLGQLAQPRSLPIGISFYTFQIITYTVDVYLGKTPVQKSLPRLMLYISFFPQLIAGPIVNYTYIAPYLSRRETSAGEVYAGLSRFIIGLSKKVLLANVCGEILAGMDMSGQLSVLGAWLGAIAYTFQIYFDFSGYSDMAIGMGRIFGFKFLENFNYPYISASVTEFWRRWHISLGSFFREYVYIPLGGNRCGRARQIFNLAVVWALTGLWHGASWNFIAWGVYYGALLIIEKQLWGVLQKIPGILRWVGTMLIVVFGWVLFYHESLGDGLHQMGAMLGFGAIGGSDGAAVYYLKQYLGVLIISALACVPWKSIFSGFGRGGAHASADSFAKAKGTLEWPRAVICCVLLGLSVAFMVSGSYNPFLYFRF